MKQLYLECFSGISGDMFVAAMLDLGADEQKLQDVLATIPVQGFKTVVSRVKKAGLDVCDFNVILEEKYENYDHDMEYLYKGKHHNNQEDDDNHDHGHNHTHNHKQQESHQVQETSNHVTAHRGMHEITEILQQTKMTEKARETALRIFTILGLAEAKAHGVELSQVHFHEVGAIDSIVDIIAAAVCLDDLEIREVIIPVLYEGSGTIRCQHGILPIPVPAVSHIVSANHLALHMTERKGELVTPTGAAIAAAIKTKDKLPKSFTISKIGTGAGKRNYEAPSLLRAMLIREESAVLQDQIIKLETNIDDCSGENLGYVMDMLLQAGARDVHYIPVFMKKNRPAYQLTVLCAEQESDQLEAIIFAETTTIGIRKVRMERSILKREGREIETSLGKACVKICDWNQDRRVYPEYESVVRLCKINKMPFRDVYQLIERETYGKFRE